MNQLSGLMDNIMAVQIIDIVIAVSIVILFRIFSSSLSYICIKMFKFKTRNKRKIKESAFKWQVLKKRSEELGYEVKKAESRRFEYQNLYHVNVFKACYPEYKYDFLNK